MRQNGRRGRTLTNGRHCTLCLTILRMERSLGKTATPVGTEEYGAGAPQLFELSL